jgi:hypothetical protein
MVNIILIISRDMEREPYPLSGTPDQCESAVHDNVKKLSIAWMCFNLLNTPYHSAREHPTNMQKNVLNRLEET